MNSEMVFEKAVRFVLDIEGGEADEAEDPGGLTNFGISSAYHPDVDVAELTLQDAVDIYHRDYWQAPRIAELHKMWAFVLLDTAVHTGADQAVRWLQEVVKVKVDGKIGPQTLGAAGRARSAYHLGRYLAKRLAYMESRGHKAKFIDGWRIRVMELFAEARNLT